MRSVCFASLITMHSDQVRTAIKIILVQNPFNKIYMELGHNLILSLSLCVCACACAHDTTTITTPTTTIDAFTIISQKPKMIQSM